MTNTQTTNTPEKFNTVAAAVVAIRTRIWGQPGQRGCECRYNIHGACKSYPIQVGHVKWHVFCDNYGRFSTSRD